MAKPGQANPKPSAQPTRIEPRGKEFTEEVSEGSIRVPDINAPPEAFHAGTMREDTAPFLIKEKSVGPTEPLGPWDELGEPEEETEESEVSSASEESEESPAEDEGGKEASSEAKARSEHIPRERFDEVNAKLKQFEESHKMLQWILEDPNRFAKLSQTKAEEPVQAKEFKVEEPGLPPGKTLEELSDKEVFDYAVRKETARVLNEQLGGVFRDLDGLKSFRGSMEDLVMRTATGSDKQPLFPRWEELRHVVQNTMSKHPTLDRREAYFLAERMVPPGAGYTPPKEVPASAPPSNFEGPTKEQGPTGAKPKKASAEAIRATRLMHLGRASQAYQGSSKPSSVEEAVRMAMREHGFPEEV